MKHACTGLGESSWSFERPNTIRRCSLCIDSVDERLESRVFSCGQSETDSQASVESGALARVAENDVAVNMKPREASDDTSYA